VLVAGGIDVERRPGVAIVRLTGDHDLSTVPILSDAIEREASGKSRVLLDLSEATFIDSSVLGLILRSGEDCIPIAGPDSFAARRFALFGIGAIIRVASSMDEALGWIGGGEAEAPAEL
jgi:anti-anti-sigma factor